jgi:hypothetical protein
MTKTEAMRVLGRLCKEKSIKVFFKETPYKRSWLYWPLLKMVIVFSNADLDSINLLMGSL